LLRKIVISTLLLVFSLGLLFWSYAAQQLDLLASFDFVQLSENDKAQKVFLETYIFDLFQTEFWSQVFRSLCIAIWVTIFLTFTIDSVKNRQMTQIFDQRIHSISRDF